MKNTTRYFTRVLLLTLTLAGCTTPMQPLEMTKLSPAVRQAEQHAKDLMLKRNYTSAAEAYLKLDAQAPAAGKYGLHAAEAYIEARRFEDARQILQRSQVTHPSLQAWRDVLLARIALADNNADEALSVLRGPYSGIPESLERQIRYYRATAYYQRGKYFEAARERVLLDPILTTEAERKENRRATWEAASHLQDPNQVPDLPPPPDVLRGWVELALITNIQIRDLATFNQSMGVWRPRFPGHPAHLEILPALTETSTVLNRPPPRQIALLLPITGQYANAAAAIRDGFLAAWYGDSNPNRPAVTLYDANTKNVTGLYQKALSEGADFVVGPLEKPAIDILLRTQTLSVPTLALNYTDAPVTQSYQKEHRFYQFGLSPEDEAGQIAERAWFDGYIRSWVLTPASAWGDRVFRAFKQRWETLGGVIQAHQSFRDAPGESEIAVRALFNNGGASSGDAPTGFIFLGAFPKQAQQIQTQLLRHNAMRLPVYATSHVFSGLPAAVSDSALDGIAFGDMPWVLDSGRQFSKFNGTGQRPKSGEMSRFYAFGIDAYEVISDLARLHVQPAAYFDGQTGTLRLDQNGRIHRQLSWARFANGTPQPLDD